MDEAEAGRWLADVPRGTFEKIEAFVAMLAEENATQNLVSRASLDHVWARHVVDSAQLLRFAPSPRASWLDLGTGAGFPGLIVALIHSGPVTMVDPRRLRVDFLRRAAEALDLDNARIICSRIESFEDAQYDVISARAFAPLGQILARGARFATANTRWVLPKGKNAKSELEAVESLWQGRFALEPSVTDPEASIIVADQVRARVRGAKRR